jgi:hypothetical protein
MRAIPMDTAAAATAATAAIANAIRAGERRSMGGEGIRGPSPQALLDKAFPPPP